MSDLFYCLQSDFSDPGDYRFLYESLPSDIAVLRDICSRFFLHYSDIDLANFKKRVTMHASLDNRYIAQALKFLDDKGLSFMCEHYPGKDRPLGICRDSSLLLCSILRGYGIAARLRTGFASYYRKDLWVDGFCLEIYDDSLQRWRRVDVRMNSFLEKQLKIGIDVDLTDLKEYEFMLAGEAWLHCRKGLQTPKRFVSRSHSGLNIIRNRMIQDLACLMKKEPLLWDVWGMMLTESRDDIALLDSLSKLLIYDSDDVILLLDFYNFNKLRMPNKVLVAHPLLGDKLVALNDYYVKH